MERYYTGHLIGCEKKMENTVEIFGNIMRKKVMIMQKRQQIMRKFLNNKVVPLAFSNV